ncbi:hypothetical protein JOM56_005385 [Amanita muscaria]
MAISSHQELLMLFGKDSKQALTLPHELVERILLLLATESVRTCRLVNRALNEIIQSSTLLQYFQACEAAGVIDNPRSPLSYTERLEALEKREEAWRKLNPAFETTIKVDRQQCSFSLNEGAYFLGDNHQKDSHYYHLPLSPQDDPRYIRIPRHDTEEGLPTRVVNFATAVYEHDLIIKAISSEIGNQEEMQQYSLDLVLLKFSTGEYHPLARHPRIHVQISPDSRLEVNAGIAGDNLVLLVHNDNGNFPDKLFMFEWKTGHKRLEHETFRTVYSEFAFISPELLLVPNLVFSHFEVWHIPPSSPNRKPPVQILCLQMPAVSDNYGLREFFCYGGPNPFLHSMPYFPPRPFFPSPESSIIIANLYVTANSPFIRPRGASYRLIMHRRALLDTIQKWTSPSLLEQQEDLETWLTNRLVVHTTADPDDASVTRLGARSELVTINPHPRFYPRYLASPDSSSISLDSCTTSSTYSFLQVPWADWGPPISRLFRVNEHLSWWIVDSVGLGQRCAFLDSDPSDRRKLTVNVADFNPHNLRRHAEMMTRLRGEGEDNGGNGSNGEGQKEKEERMEKLEHEGMFSEEVYMGLKCVVYRAPDEYDFDLVLMDGERLLGLKTEVSTLEWHK